MESELKYNQSLKPFNTFGVEVIASAFFSVSSREQLTSVLKNNHQNLLILGGGSNVLFTKNFDGLVALNNIKGIEIIEETKDDVLIKVSSGEVWHQFVLYCVQNNYGGVENLSLIPGTVGASPIQNIGAYGVEVKDVIEQVEALSLIDYSIKKFSNSECQFGYRSSVFKTTLKNNYFILSVTFKLRKKPIINTSYGAIEEELKNMKVNFPTIKDVSTAVINIRKSKLPNPEEIGNSGSFFKNPTVSLTKKNQLLAKYPSMPNYIQTDGTFKLAAGWLIEMCGWKGKRINNYGVHINQALVLVNYGGAKGVDIYNLSKDIVESVKNKFDIELEREVNII